MPIVAPNVPVITTATTTAAPTATAAAAAASDAATNFEFADLTHKVSLNGGNINTLIQLLCSIVNGEDKFSFHNHSNVQRHWQAASHKVTVVIP
ncbi:hypothetical protein ONZ51_g12559 [Trametes cubensis]|uniref:Uncharacterized protein n=1 Tax=Trametes cubensis TaxID=1111947 RepID=A0AAD7X3I1_9APHY|nr:hypothetical protein ONZ51_g12559 [Trametes cubensis]